MLALLLLATVCRVNAGGPTANAHAPSIVAASLPRANAGPNAETQDRGAPRKPVSSHHAAIVVPVGTIPVVNLSVLAPGTYPLQVTARTVTVRWYDRSTNELGFKVYRRDLSGNWQLVYQVPTRAMAGGGDYSWVDTSTNLSGQCYMIAAYNGWGSGDTGEECTVRPDPSRFPQNVASAAPQWRGLSDSNDGTGALIQGQDDSNLRYGDQTWGVNLVWGSSSLWRVEAQGGPRLMKGQAVALRVWGGGWLKYGTQTFGVDLQLSDTPVYEWYAIGQQFDASENAWAGTGLTYGGFALWNSSAQAYLVRGYETWGIDLKWYRPSGSPSPTPTPSPTHGVKTERVLNCSVQQQAVDVWIADQTAGGGFVDKGTVDAQYGSAGCPASGSVPLTFSPISGHNYVLVAVDRTLPACDGRNDPQEGACQKMYVQFVGDANGYTRTDIIDIGTQITP
jgi:hypothetical protein